MSKEIIIKFSGKDTKDEFKNLKVRKIKIGDSHN